MKRLIATVLAAASLSSFAAWERIGLIQVADVKTQGEAVATIGKMIGNPFVAAALGAGLADLATVKFFGPAREGASTVVPLFFERKEGLKSPAEALDGLEYAVLYPVSLSKADFIKRHAKAVETNGIVVVKGDLRGKNAGKTKTYVAFSADGKWASASDKAEQAKLALDDIKNAEKSIQGEVVRLCVGKKAIAALVAAAKASPDVKPEAVAHLEAVTSFNCGFKVADCGLDIGMGLCFEDGSELAKCGLKPLGENPLAFAGKGAVIASARAEDSGSNLWGSSMKGTELIDVCKTNGLDISSFLACEKKGTCMSYTIDPGAMFKFFSRNIGELLVTVDCEKLGEDMKKLTKCEKFSAKGPASCETVLVKGFVSQWTPAERFAATIPEAAGKKPFYVGFLSISSIAKVLVPYVLVHIPEEQRGIMKPLLETLASESKSGIASMGWRPKEGDTMRFLTRISADEVRGIGGMLCSGCGLESIMFKGCGDAKGDED